MIRLFIPLAFALTLIHFTQAYGVEHRIDSKDTQDKISKILLNNETLTSTLKSGLSSQILKVIRYQRDKDSQVVIHSKLNIKYDLWDEEYLSKVDDGAIKKYKNLNQLVHSIGSIDQHFSDEFKKDLKSYDIEVIFFVNPITKAQSKLIKEWMAERFVGPSSLELGSSTNAFVAGVVNKVVSQQLDRSIYGSDQEIVIHIKNQRQKKEGEK
ncbi:MAG: hypothetical protein M9899_09375 [Bdellovibrionaceae bacterium]|nr:hypothetical protein [Pseudobdellovibrionaceae bacterium]